MSGPRMASASIASIVSIVAERRSSSNIASSPKMSPGPEGGERDLAPVGVLAHGARVAGADDVTRVGLVALAEDDLARARNGAGGRPRRRARGRRPERRENWDPAEQLGGLKCAGRHVPRGSTTPRRRAHPHYAISSARSRRRRVRTAARDRRQDGDSGDRQQDGEGDHQHARDHLEHAAGVAERVAGRPAVAGARPSQSACASRGPRGRRRVGHLLAERGDGALAGRDALGGAVQLGRLSRRVTQRERRVASLNQQVAYSTVELEIRGTRKSGATAATPGDRWTPGDALKDAGRVLEVIAGVLVIGLAILLPIAILAGAGRLRQPRPHPPPPRAGARSLITEGNVCSPPGVVDTPRSDGEHTGNGRAARPGAGLRPAGGVGPRAGGRGLPPAALRRGRGDLPRGRPVQHVLPRPLRPCPGGPRARRRPPDRAGHVRPGRHLRRAGDVRRRAPLGDGRDDRPARGAGDPRPGHAPADAAAPAAGGRARRLARRAACGRPTSASPASPSRPCRAAWRA